MKKIKPEELAPADLVAGIRLKYELSQAELARLVNNVSERTVWRWENNKARPHKREHKLMIKIYKDGPEEKGA